MAEPTSHPVELKVENQRGHSGYTVTAMVRIHGVFSQGGIFSVQTGVWVKRKRRTREGYAVF